jgi:hypothetical protein
MTRTVHGASCETKKKMKRMEESFINLMMQNLSLILTAVLIAAFLLYSILDIFGLMHKYRDKIPNFILLIICISLTESILDRKIEVEKLHQSIEVLQKNADSNREMLMGLEKRNLTEKLKQSHSMSDPILESIFREHINNEIQFFDNLLNNEFIVIDNREQYNDYYIKSLDVISNLHKSKVSVKSTSILSDQYLWKTEGEFTPLELAFKKFIADGNRMTRLFYVDGNIDEVTKKKILDRQKNLGINVYTLDYNEYKNTVFELDKPPLFSVFDCGEQGCQHNLAWEVTVDNSDNPTSFKYMKTLERCSTLIGIFDAFSKAASCKRY